MICLQHQESYEYINKSQLVFKMAPITIRKAIGAVKDQTSISIAKVAGAVAPDLEVLIVKATTHDDDPTDDKYFREILNLTGLSKGYVNAFIITISKRLTRTRDWIVALKALMLIHRLLIYGHFVLKQQILSACSRGVKILDLSEFRDEAHPYSWDHSDFVKNYALYLVQKLDFLVNDRKKNGVRFEDMKEEPYRGRTIGDSNCESICLDDMEPKKILERLNHLLNVLDRFLICKPTGCAKNSKMVVVALHMIVKDSFNLYLEICDVLGVLLDRFQDMDYANCVMGFDSYANAAKRIDDLVTFYSWCKEFGIVYSSDYPKVKRITANLLGTLEKCLRDRGNTIKRIQQNKQDSFSSNMNEIKSLPPPKAQSRSKEKTEPVAGNDLLDLSGLDSFEEQRNKLTLALFSGSLDSDTAGSWEPFGELSSKTDWELAVVETSSSLSKQKVNMGGNIDFLLLDGMYDQGMALMKSVGNNGSASSVANNGGPVLALPSPVDHQEDPFKASLMVPPPAYVQIVDFEKKEQLLAQEKMLWQQYETSGMQGQLSFDKISSGYNGFNQSGGGYYYRTP